MAKNALPQCSKKPGRHYLDHGQGPDFPAVIAACDKRSMNSSCKSYDIAGGAEARAVQCDHRSDLRRDRDEKISRLFSVAPIGTGVVAGRVIVEVNDRFCEITGWSKSELLGQKSRLLYPSEKEFNLVGATRLEQIEASGRSHLETQFRHKDGAILDILMDSTLVDPENPDEGCIFCVLDITQRKRAERALNSQAAQLNAIFNNAPYILVLLDKNLHIIRVNKVGLKFFGARFDEVYATPLGSALKCNNLVEGKTCGELPECPDCPIRTRVETTLQTGTPCNQEEVTTKVISGKHLEKRNFLLSTTRLYIEEEMNVLLSLAEITELKEAQAAKSFLEHQLFTAQKLEVLGQVAGGIAHDLNNILAPVMSYGQMIFRRCEEESPEKQYSGKIVYAAKRAADLLRQLLTFSRRNPPNLKKLDLNFLLLRFRELIDGATRSDVSIELQLSSELPIINGDEGQLEQLIMNLVMNAQDAMPRGGTFTLETCHCSNRNTDMDYTVSVPCGEYVRLSATDTGTGMDEQVLAHIFDPFFTTKGADKGTGLGLSSVYGIVKQHGGHITVASRLGEGSAFNIYFPVISSKETLAISSLAG